MNSTTHGRPATGNGIPAREWFVVLTWLTIFALLATRPSIRGNDGVGHYVYLASLLRGGDLNFSDEYRAYDRINEYPFKFEDLPRAGATGRPSNRYGIGAALLWAPFAAAAHLATVAFAPDQADGLGRPYELAVGYGTVFWGSVGLLLMYRRLRRQFTPWVAGLACLGLMFATPLGFYVYAHGSMAHGVNFFAMVGALLSFEWAWRSLQWQRWAVCGALLALAVITRFQDATWALLLGLALALGSLRASPRPSLPRYLSCLGAALIGGVLIIVPQCIAWKVIYGSYLSGPTPYLDSTAGSFSVWPVHAWEALFSARRGVLTWHPLFGIGLIGLAWIIVACRPASGGGTASQPSQLGESCTEHLRVLAWLGLIGFAAQAWLVGSWSIWWAGASFGNRFFISSLPFIGLGLAWVLHACRGKWPRAAATIVILGLILWNAALLVQYALELVPREEGIPFSQLAKQNFIDVPRAILSRLGGG